MKRHVLLGVAAWMLLPLAQAASPLPEPAPSSLPAAPPTATFWRSALAGWPARPRLAAEQMAQRYGPPARVTSDRVEWYDVGDFSSVGVSRHEIPHDFPRPHSDFLEHTVAYRVPADRCDDLLAFDGSLSIDRTAGTLTARGDLEAHDLLALNLAHDLVIGATTVEAAREAFGRGVLDEALGLGRPYAAELQFAPAVGSTADADLPVMSGSPVRPPADGDPTGEAAHGDVAEILGFLVAMNDHEILASREARDRFDADPEVRAFAAMLLQEHGEDLRDTLALGTALGVRPLETTAVDGLRRARAADLAALLRLDGDAFGTAFLQAMIDDHRDAMVWLEDWSTAVADGPLDRHLADVRSHALAHLASGRSLLETTNESLHN